MPKANRRPVAASGLWAATLLLLAWALVGQAAEAADSVAPANPTPAPNAEEQLPVEPVPPEKAVLADPSAPPIPSPEAVALVKSLQKRYEQINSFKASFKQTSFHPKLKMEIEDGGEVTFVKPNRMRWDYSLRRTYQIYGALDRIWIVEPEKKKATIYPFDAQLAVTFMAGLGEVANSFHYERLAPLPEALAALAPQPGVLALKLTPKEPNAMVREIRLAIDPSGPDVVATEVIDPYGKPTRTQFFDRVYNIQVTPESMVYRANPDWEILDPSHMLEGRSHEE